MTARIIIFIIAGSMLTFAQQSVQGLIQGRITTIGSADPIGGVVVRLSGIGAVQGSSGEATTDLEGNFSISLEPGRYTVTATRTGFVSKRYGNGRAGKPVTVDSGRSAQIAMSLESTGAVEGRIFDSAGNPLEGVAVGLTQAAQRPAFDLRTARTNDRGEYRLYWIPPGEYQVVARLGAAPGPTDFEGVIERHRQPLAGENYMPTFFPGTYDPGQASIVKVSAGVELRGIDFAMTKARTTTIRGRVVSPVSDIAGAVIQLSIRPLDNNTARITPPTPLTLSRSSFQASGLLPGRYRIIAMLRIPNQRNLSGEIYVDVGQDIVENLNIPVIPSRSVRGVIRFEDSPSAAKQALDDKKPIVSLRNEIGGAFLHSSAEPNPDGTFVAPDIGMGIYRVSIVGLPPDFYLTSALLNGVDILNDGFQLQNDPSALLELSISGQGGRIDGVVRAGGDFGSSHDVVLVPEANLRHREDLFKRVQADEYGRFSLRGIPPGQYTLIATEAMRPTMYTSPELLAAIQTKGKAVRVQKNDFISMEVDAAVLQ